MNKNTVFFLFALGLISFGFIRINYTSHHTPPLAKSKNTSDTLLFANEKHFKNIKQLTFGGDNAEAYWSFNNQQLIFQKSNPAEGILCDQIYIGNVNGNFDPKLVSTGSGRTTCAYFLKGDSLVLYASTHHKNLNCPIEPPKSEGYVWPIYPEFDIFIAKPNGEIVKQLTNDGFYNAEATVSPKGNKIVYTSNKSGDLELYVLDLDSGKEIQITNELGYDGGAFFSPDGTKLVWRSSRPKTTEEISKYKSLLSKNLVAPSEMEIYIGNIDGTEIKQVTNLGGANWAPFFHPSGNKILFSSNHQNKRFPFNIFMVNIDGSGLEQITYDPVFASFPMFSPDGKKIAFSSNRNNGGTRETNLFVADWVE